eukprot:g3054.t1
MVKPDGVQRGLVGGVVARFEAKGFELVALRQMVPSRAHLEKHYADLASKPFFPGLIDYMESGPVVAMVWAGDGVVAEGRKMLGATKPSESEMGTIRGDYCIDIGRNVCHGSDSAVSAEAEIALWFPHGLERWQQHSGPWVCERLAQEAEEPAPRLVRQQSPMVEAAKEAAAALLTGHSPKIFPRQSGLQQDRDAPITGNVVLAGDIGGTNSRFSLFEIKPGEQHLRGHRAPGFDGFFSREYKNDAPEFESFVDVIQCFLREARREVGARWRGGDDSNSRAGEVKVACLAVAGAVIDNAVSMTNCKGWIVSGAQLVQMTKIRRVRIINDFIGMAYGLLTLHSEHYVKIRGDASHEGAPIACVGAGTGLGVAYLTADAERIGVDPSSYVAFASEGGHADWAPRGRGSLQYALHHFLKRRHAAGGDSAHQRCSTERVVSGPGLRSVYDFLRQYKGEGGPENVVKQADEEWLDDGRVDWAARVNIALDARITAEGPVGGGDIISMHGAKGPLCDPVCRKACEIFFEAYGAACGSAALTFLPRAGLFVVGGIAPKNLSWFLEEDGPFQAAFRDKGRQTIAIAGIPVYVVTHEGCGLRGAHVVAYRELVALERAQFGSSSVAGGGSSVVTNAGPPLLALDGSELGLPPCRSAAGGSVQGGGSFKATEGKRAEQAAGAAASSAAREAANANWIFTAAGGAAVGALAMALLRRHS